MRDKHGVSRRDFLETAGVATGAAMAAGAFAHPAIGAVKGANEKLNIAILGPGGRAQEHLRILLKMKNGAEAGRHHRPLRRLGRRMRKAGTTGWLLLGREVRPGP